MRNVSNIIYLPLNSTSKARITPTQTQLGQRHQKIRLTITETKVKDLLDARGLAESWQQADAGNLYIALFLRVPRQFVANKIAASASLI